MGEQVVPVVKFNGENWTTWKFQIQVVLKSKGLYEMVVGKTTKPVSGENAIVEWERKDAKAQEQLVCRLENKPLTHILSCNSAEEMWKKLTTIYENKSQVSVHLLQQRFFSMQYNEEGGIAEFISQIEEIQGNLKQQGEEISDKMAMTKVLMSLPSNLSHFISAWESTPNEKQTLSELMSRLLIEEERNIKKNGTGSALASRVGTGSKQFRQQHRVVTCFKCNKTGHIKRNCTSTNMSTNETKKVCLYCKKMGHLIKDCWFRKRKEEEEKNKNSAANNTTTQALVGASSILNCSDMSALIGKSSSENDWWLDSGATEHMCYIKEKFKEFNTLDVHRQVKVGNGSILDVQGIRKVEVQAWSGNKWIKTDICDVLFVPDLDVNLFSLSTVLDKGLIMQANKDRCNLLDNNGHVRAVANREGRLFKMNFINIEDTSSQCHMVESLTTWHRKMAHIHFDQVRKILKRSEIKFVEVTNPFCKECLPGKQHRLPFPASLSRAQRTGELIHGDLEGPMEEPSMGGARYFLLLKDDFSNYRFVYFLKNKSDAMENIEKFLNMVETQTGNKVKKLRTDNGLEVVNNRLKILLEQRGIIHEKTCTYSPQQNGRAEREMRTLVEAARTLLHSRNMDKTFWAEAVNTAVFVLNRASCSSVKIETPFKLWVNKDFDIKTFKEFGSAVSVHIPKEKRRKLDKKCEEGIFIGYENTTKGYRVYFPQKNKVEIHRDIVFIPDSEKDSKVTKKINQKAVEQIVMLDIEENQPDIADIPELRQIDLEQEADIEEREADIEEREADNEGEQEYRQRQRRDSRKPKWMNDYEMSFYTETEELTTVEEAVTSKNSEKWKEAMQKELKVLRENNTWTEVPWPVNKKVIESKWIFKQKSESEFKARLVAVICTIVCR